MDEKEFEALKKEYEDKIQALVDRLVVAKSLDEVWAVRDKHLILTDEIESKGKRFSEALREYQMFYYKWLRKKEAKFGLSRRYKRSDRENSES